MSQKENRQAILKVTQQMVRQNGYNGFSFRHVAEAVGIKSSSVHYHFRTKEDLGAAVAKNYTEQFMMALGSPSHFEDLSIDPLDNFISAFEAALTKDKKMCLCGIFAAEASGLPPMVVDETKAFFLQNIEWLEKVFVAKSIDDSKVRGLAISVLSLLEGALITCNIMGEESGFESVRKSVHNLVHYTVNTSC